MKNIRRRSYRNYSDRKLIEAVASSASVAGVLRELGLKPAGGNYANIQTLIKGLNLDTSHWTGQAHRKGSTLPQSITPIEKFLVKGRVNNNVHLKSRLIREGYLENKCSRCGISEWLGEPLVLHLDHKNGDRSDNRLDNLRLLCPNCHSQTTTYCGKNVGSGSKLSTFTRLDEFKSKVVAHAETFGFSSASKKYDLHPGTVSKWVTRQHGGRADTSILKIGDSTS